MLLLSCCREVEAVVVFRDGGQSGSLPFSPLVAVEVSFGMLFSCFWLTFFEVAVFRYFLTGGVRSKPPLSLGYVSLYHVAE